MQCRPELGRALFAAARDPQTATWTQLLAFDDAGEWGRENLLTAIDILQRWFEQADPVLLDLFEGWVRSRIIADLGQEGPPPDYRPDQAVRLALGAWVDVLRPKVDAAAVAVFESDVQRTISNLALPTTRRVNALFLGDCLQFEVVTALVGQSGRAGISIDATVIGDKTSAVLRNRVRELPQNGFKVVFFSPFSHRFHPDYDALIRPAAALWSSRKRMAQLMHLLDDVRSTIQLLGTHFDCPIYVHNTAGSIQSFGGVGGFAKIVSTTPSRHFVRDAINQTVSRWIDDASVHLNGRLQLIDEEALGKRLGTTALGKIYFNSASYHPTRLGIALGTEPYFEAIYSAAHLATKKVVICDLDNTLWEGVIGEGAVQHHADRQQVLKRLRERGVLLSINSKNDPQNVRWDGGCLTEADFVAPQINWDAKSKNVARIRDALNLKVKDFVFIDDRPDELERVTTAFPDILTLDATRPETWRLLSHWYRCLSPSIGEDRTQLYHERAEREQFLETRSASISTEPGEDETAALVELQLGVTIRQAGKGDLKRVVELINRTNQFNLCGSRTTVQEMQTGLGSTQVVLTADARDKFGKMGTVGVMVVCRSAAGLEIPIFVLSCRVFGFGIEFALLNAAKRFATPTTRLIGLYRETAANQPCRQMYPKSGLAWQTDRWVGPIANLQADPPWLNIQYELGDLRTMSAEAAESSTANG